jgi:hypothetical protein
MAGIREGETSCVLRHPRPHSFFLSVANSVVHDAHQQGHHLVDAGRLFLGR